jgi:hypothetical protein
MTGLPWRRVRCLAALAAGGALVAAGCVPLPPSPPPPPPPPVATYCAPSAPSSPATYQAAFDALRHTYTEWASADESVPIDLPDGRVVWVFDDTSVGHLLADGTLSPSNALARNSFVVQSGACFTPLLGGVPLARTSLIPEPAANEWYWPTSGVVDAAHNQLLVFVLHVQRTGTGPLDFTILDVRVATFSLPGLTLTGVQPLPFPTSSLAYGSTSFDDATNAMAPDVYAYVSNQRNAYVARASVDEVLTGPWEFWDGTGWSSDSTQAAPMAWNGIPSSFDPGHVFGPGSGPAAQPSVIADGTGYLLTAKLADAFSSDVSVFTGASPTGPWTYVGQVADTTQPDTIAYGAYTQLALPGTSGPTTVYNTNVSPFLSNPPPSSIQSYGPHFVVPDPTVFPPPP